LLQPLRRIDVSFSIRHFDFLRQRYAIDFSSSHVYQIALHYHYRRCLLDVFIDFSLLSSSPFVSSAFCCRRQSRRCFSHALHFISRYAERLDLNSFSSLAFSSGFHVSR